MTILVTPVKVGMMEKLTDPVTSDSELEEGEIANDEIEIISEIIRRPPKKIQQLNTRDNKVAGKPLLNRKSGSVIDKKLQRPKSQGYSGSVSKTDVRHSNEGKSIQKVMSQKSPGLLKKRSPARSVKRLGQPSRSSSKTESIYSSSNRSNRDRNLASVKKKEDKVCRSKPTSEISEDTKWKNTFESITPGSVESMDLDSDGESDEEIRLRLEALNSVVNAKTKDVSNSDGLSSIGKTTPEPTTVNGIQEEDEDEELLRAQLLIEVAKKQTKELEGEIESEQNKLKFDQPLQPAFEKRNLAQKNIPKSIQIPKADRLVIDLRNDSSDSSDSEDDSVRISIANLLKTARQTVEEKVSVIPHAMSHLPRNQQEEYQRLKQEILRRESQLAKQGIPKVTLIQSQTDNLPKSDLPAETGIDDGLVSSIIVDSAISKKLHLNPVLPDNHVVMDCSAHQKPIANLSNEKLSSASLPDSSLSQNNSKENEGAENTASIAEKPLKTSVSKLNPSVATSRPADGLKSSRSPSKASDSNSSKLVALKQQLLHKKRVFLSTKEALKSQLELVDKNRLLWLKSNQDVSRLKSMLQTAEETERQLRSQLSNSQDQMQRLKTKMQSVERQVEMLHSGIVSTRKRRTSTRLRPKTVAQQGIPTPTNFAFSNSTPFRVKPRVFAQAVAKTNHLTYRRPMAVSNETVVSLSGVESVPLLKKQTKTVEGKKTIHDEQWLYGVLGDDLGLANDVCDFPTWSPHGHASRLVNEGFRLDSSRIVCCNQLDSAACKIIPCPFQHLPQLEIRHFQKSSLVVTEGLARLAMSVLLQLSVFQSNPAAGVITHHCLPQSLCCS